MLVIARHGNTFAPGERAVWVGSQQDINLVPQGEMQARALGAALKPWAQSLRKAVSSPMRRTQHHAGLVLHEAGISSEPQTMGVLQELDYGAWAGRHRDDIIQSGGSAALALWEQQARYPLGVGFAPPRKQHLTALQQWLAAMDDQPTGGPRDWSFAVTHGGVLRLLSTLLSDRRQDAQNDNPKVLSTLR